jgi:hypothetical protein
MKALFLCLVLAAPPAFGEHQEASPARAIVLYAQFQPEPPPAVFDALRDAVNTIMASMACVFARRSVSAARSGTISVELAVIMFSGKCDVVSPTRHSSNPGPLGWTHISDGVILPFAKVDCQGMRGFIQKQLFTRSAEDREGAYGRALGRVLALELYHIFANTTSHGSCGVGKSNYTVQELLSPEFQFAARESLALKSSRATPRSNRRHSDDNPI